MERTNRKAVNDKLRKYCHLSDDDGFIEITEWTNGEGWDINIETKNSSKLFSLTYGELDAINYLTKALEYEHD